MTNLERAVDRSWPGIRVVVQGDHGRDLGTDLMVAWVPAKLLSHSGLLPTKAVRESTAQ